MVSRKFSEKFNLRMSDDERGMLRFLTEHRGLSSDAATIKQLIRLAYREAQESVRTKNTVSKRK